MTSSVIDSCWSHRHVQGTGPVIQFCLGPIRPPHLGLYRRTTRQQPVAEVLITIAKIKDVHLRRRVYRYHRIRDHRADISATRLRSNLGPYGLINFFFNCTVAGPTICRSFLLEEFSFFLFFVFRAEKDERNFLDRKLLVSKFWQKRRYDLILG